MRWSGVCVSIGFASAFRCSCFSVSGRPEDRTQRGSVISRTWATSPRRPFFVESGTSGSNRKPPGPKPGVLPTAPLPDVVLFIQSERSRPIRPVGRSVPEPTISSSPNWRDNQTSLRSDGQQPVWESNPSLRVERAVPCADRRTGHVMSLWARTFHAVDREALESSSPALQAGARPSQLPVRVSCWMNPRQKPDVAVTPGFA